MVPSPDGTLLGWASTHLKCGSLSLVVEFISAQTGEIVDGPHTYELPKDSTYIHDWGYQHFDSYFSVAWSEEDELIVAFNGVTLNSYGKQRTSDDLRGYRIAPNAPPIPFDSMDRSCLTPATTSSFMNSSGEWPTMQDGKLVILQEAEPFDVFGCNP